MQWLRERSAQFSLICPFSPSAQNETELAVAQFPTAKHNDRLIGRYEAAYVGYAVEENFRSLGSSGGMVSWVAAELRSEEHTSELQSLMRISYAVFCLKKKIKKNKQ